MNIDFKEVPLYIYAVWQTKPKTNNTKLLSSWTTRDEARMARRTLRTEGISNTFITRSLIKIENPIPYND
jgi:hypothetical protein